MNNTIQYLERSAVDAERWDECIDRSANSLVYAHSWWLDRMAENWSALVLNDYEAVMPLTWKRKYGFFYLYQPWFTASLGAFKKERTSASLVDFLKAIPPKYVLWDFQVNECNDIDEENELKVRVTRRANHFVQADESSYNSLKNTYSRLCRRKLIMAGHSQLIVKTNEISPSEIIELYRKQYAQKHPDIGAKDYRRLTDSCNIAFNKGLATTYAALLPTGNIAAFYLVLHDQNYSYSLIGGSNEEGKETGAFYLLTDMAIQHAAHNKRGFRFEGSDMPGVAFFNKQFGPAEMQYAHIQQNKLPFWAKLFKQL
ncbi:MAG: GNAT family N-acetyltransferase [Chitinophagaceae bacterium]|nr:GNAT family N-acetyltransferase [Chitinophagaceae bacterium]